MRSRTLMDLQVAALAAGALFAASIVATDMYRFTLTGGDLNQFRDTALPNPLITPCFYGAIVFAVALRWAVRLQRRAPDVRGERYLAWLLAGGTLFALANLGYECFLFYMPSAPGTRSFCSGGEFVSPFETPCFVGFLFYVAALLITLAVERNLHRQATVATPPELPAHDRVA